MNLPGLRWEVDEEGIALITVDRPEVRNALDRPTWEALGEAAEQAGRHPEVRGLIVTGSGDRAFVAGSDIRELAKRSVIATLEAYGQRALSRLEALEIPTVAAINGHALGGGCELAMACDLRVAVTHAKLGLPEVGLGIIPGAGGTVRLARLVGHGRAKELIMTGAVIGAEEAHAIGLVNRVVAPERLLEECRALLRAIFANGPVAVRLAKALLDGGLGAPPSASLLLERLAQAVLFATEDRAEGMRAFLDKRPPEYRGG